MASHRNLASGTIPLNSSRIPPDLEPNTIRAGLRTGWLGQTLECVEEVDSTNTQVAAKGRAGAPSGLVMVADRQTAGRGRLQRAWHSPESVNLYFSVLLRPPWQPQKPPPVSLAVGVAIAETIRPRLSHPPALKWPNDLLVQDRKMAGILVEVAATRNRIDHVVLGIGLNVNQESFPPPLDQSAISLRQATGRPTHRGELLAELLNALEPLLETLNQDSHDSMIESWNRYFAWQGQAIRVQTGSGEIRGIALGVNAVGALRIRDERGQEHQLLSGDTFRIADPLPK